MRLQVVGGAEEVNWKAKWYASEMWYKYTLCYAGSEWKLQRCRVGCGLDKMMDDSTRRFLPRGQRHQISPPTRLRFTPTTGRRVREVGHVQQRNHIQSSVARLAARPGIHAKEQQKRTETRLGAFLLNMRITPQSFRLRPGHETTAKSEYAD